MKRRLSDHQRGAPPERGVPPFSRPIDVEKMPADGAHHDIEARPEECEAIAAALNLPAVSFLRASLDVTPGPQGRVHVGGKVTAQITQVCVVSLDPFESTIEQPVDLAFAPVAPSESESARPSHRRRVEPEAKIVAAVDEDDPPDPIIGGRIDLGAVAVEFLALSLDFYPRKPGVHFTDVLIGESEPERRSAFAALERLKDQT